MIRSSCATPFSARSIAERSLRSFEQRRAGEAFCFSREPPALVTMDLTLPLLDGLGAIRQIREMSPRASILVISALNSHKTAMEALALGACGFLTKPFTAREISEALEQLAQHAAIQG